MLAKGISQASRGLFCCIEEVAMSKGLANAHAEFKTGKEELWPRSCSWRMFLFGMSMVVMA